MTATEQREEEIEVNDNAFQIRVINYNETEPKQFASLTAEDSPKEILEEIQFEGSDVHVEQNKHPDLIVIRKQTQAENGPRLVKKRFVLIDEVLNFLSDPGDESKARSVIPKHLVPLVVRQYHDDNGHMGIDKTHDTIKQKYFWPNMYKGLYDYVSACVTCQARALKKQNQTRLLYRKWMSHHTNLSR